jgi:hypothetical protein
MNPGRAPSRNVILAMWLTMKNSMVPILFLPHQLLHAGSSVPLAMNKRPEMTFAVPMYDLQPSPPSRRAIPCSVTGNSLFGSEKFPVPQQGIAPPTPPSPLEIRRGAASGRGKIRKIPC